MSFETMVKLERNVSIFEISTLLSFVYYSCWVQTMKAAASLDFTFSSFTICVHLACFSDSGLDMIVNPRASAWRRLLFVLLVEAGCVV